MNRLAADVQGAHPLFICEGKGEKVIIEILLESNTLIFPKSDIYKIIRRCKAKEIQENYLNFKFDWPVVVVRLLDSRSENFVLNNLYRDRFKVINVYTRPELEMLAIIKEGKFSDFANKHKSKMKASEYCKSKLGMPDIKKEDFLKDYWDDKSLIKAIKEYHRLSNLKDKEFCLFDLLK